MLKRLDEAGRKTWAAYVTILLMKYGFGIVWLEQQVGNEEVFLKLFTQRVKDCCFQEWSSEIRESARLRTYREFKSALEPEQYLSSITVMKYKRALARFRCPSHKLRVESGRHENVLLTVRCCPFCVLFDVSVIEDEYHFLMSCPLYADDRAVHIPKYYYTFPSREKFNYLLSNANSKLNFQLAIFIFKSFQTRERFLKEV